MSTPEKFAFDTDDLEALAAKLKSIQNQMDDSDGWMLQYAGELGGRDVDDALDDFESRWNDGRKRIDDNCGNLVKAVEKSVEKIREVDKKLADELTTKPSTA